MLQQRMTGAEIVLKALVDQGVEVVFGYPGGAVLPLYDALFKQNRIRHVLTRHEQAAVHAAEGYARSTGKVGVVLVTSGPGATNAVTGLLDALLDSVPLVCLSGQVPTQLIGTDAFQEADTTGITRPCTKHNYLVKDVETLAGVMHEAFHVARTGRPGPVVVDLPKNVQVSEGAYVQAEQVRHKSYRPPVKGDAAQIEKAVALMASAKRPVFYCGGGVINSGPAACAALAELVRDTGYPITLTLQGLGAFPASDRQFLGMLGMHGTYEANLAMHGCDVMVAIGARFDDRVTGRIDGFAPNAQIVHVDVDAASINKNVRADIAIVGDAGSVIADMHAAWRKHDYRPDAEALTLWWRQIDTWRARKCLAYAASDAVIKPQYAIERLYALAKGHDAYFTTEVGQHQMWAAQFARFDSPLHWMTSGGLGTMGYGFPASLGVQIAHPESLVVCIAGEASFMMNMQEIATAVQYGLAAKVFILNNSYMGMVRQWQELLHGSRYSESRTEALPDIVKLADAFGATGLVVEKPADLDATILKMIETPGPVLVDVRVDPDENCFPMIPSGATHDNMLLGELVGGRGPAVTEAGKGLV
ncbi:acetolactate synthase III, large subunit [uncultured Alphaproteobacteria bacterium]|uniref:Acetolactate synthase n=1 Tax=uncultured Alphaproteobacteria bacterium TaxID=91750 RepID=A0A212K793_9PROT|nr:acetolactate synthase III, large subunit [uncultured Alphaproteobacteria bacterium]